MRRCESFTRKHSCPDCGHLINLIASILASTDATLPARTALDEHLTSKGGEVRIMASKPSYLIFHLPCHFITDSEFNDCQFELFAALGVSLRNRNSWASALIMRSPVPIRKCPNTNPGPRSDSG